MVPHAILQKNEDSANLYLLVRYPNRFHIITVNGKLTEEAEERILSAPCSDSALDEMGIKRLTLHRADMPGVGIGGNLAGDILMLHTRDKKLRYILSDDYSEEEMEALFDGLKRLQPPKNSKSSKFKKDWRAGQQDEKLGIRLSGVGFLVNTAAVFCGAGALIDGQKHPIWFLLSLAVAFVALMLYLRYPLYFSLLGNKEYQYRRYHTPVTQLLLAAATPIISFYPFGMNIHTFQEKPLLIVGAVGAVLLALLLYTFSREMRECLSAFLSLSLFGAILFYFAAGYLNTFLNFDELPPSAYEVVEKESADNCTIQLNGEKVELHLRLALQDFVQPGDSVMVVYDRGFFGAEYAYVVEKAE